MHNIKKIEIEVIPHDQQRYDTCGDYFFEDGILKIKVSETKKDWRYQWLVAFHELAEALMILQKDIRVEDIDEFDKSFESIRSMFPAIIGDQEPGGMLAAPYFEQHQIATRLERCLAVEMGVRWDDYDSSINKL